MNTSPSPEFMKKFTKSGVKSDSTKNKAKAIGGKSRLAKMLNSKKR